MFSVFPATFGERRNSFPTDPRANGEYHSLRGREISALQHVLARGRIELHEGRAQYTRGLPEQTEQTVLHDVRAGRQSYHRQWEEQRW